MNSICNLIIIIGKEQRIIGSSNRPVLLYTAHLTTMIWIGGDINYISFIVSPCT
jgi:hypothetical protein